MIPVLIAPVYNRHDLLERMLRSITHPVGRGLVIDNSMSSWHLPHFVGPEWKVTEPPFTSFGYPGSINHGIIQTPDADWWMWVSNDVEFGNGDMDNIAQMMDAAGDEPKVITYHFAMGAVNRAAIEAVGLFDEWSFWPLYFDDNDFAYRCDLAGFGITYYDGAMSEGADGHQTSLTIFSDPVIRSRNAETWALNAEAYEAKWGGLPGNEKYRTPWAKRLPLWATRPDLRGRTDRLW